MWAPDPAAQGPATTLGGVPQSRLSRPRAVCLDLDGTLLDGTGMAAVVDETCGLLAAAHPGLDAQELQAATLKAWEDYWPEVKVAFETGLMSGSEISLEAWRRAIALCGPGDMALAKQAVELQQPLVRRAHRLFDDVNELMAGLHGAGLPLALVTNGASDTQREKLACMDMTGWFDAIVVSAEVGFAKPDPRIFAHTCALLGEAPGDCWHVGDNLQADIAGAQSSGLVAVWVNRTGSTSNLAQPPDLEVTSLSELLPSLG